MASPGSATRRSTTAGVTSRYGDAGGSGGASHGPTKGSSLSLLKRLLYSHILYNSVAVGFESGWFVGEGLSPIGRIQQSALLGTRARSARRAAHPGCPAARFQRRLDVPPASLLGHVYRVCGISPWPGRLPDRCHPQMLYPGYQDSSYFHDESGFNTPTPYGDIADCILSDAPLRLLARYPAVVVAGELSADARFATCFSNMSRPGAASRSLPAISRSFPAGWQAIPRQRRRSSRRRRGTPTILPGAFGVETHVTTANRIRSDVDRPLPKPYLLRPEARKALDALFRRQMLFDAGGELSLITCRKGPGLYTVGIFNNGWQMSGRWRSDRRSGPDRVDRRPRHR